jgi:16S rRNA (cytosine967-C5)-methyltransferase
MDDKPKNRPGSRSTHGSARRSGQRSGQKSGQRTNYADRRKKAKPAVSSRLVVLDLMEEIIGKGHPLQEAVKRHEDWGKLDDRDRRFARRLITIILRYRRTALEILGRYLQKPINRKDRKAQAVLILGTVELVWADGDAHAVVDQAVRMMRDRGFTHMTGLANAVLRKVASDQADLVAEQHDPLLNAPLWLREHLVKDWPGEAKDIMAASLEEPSLDFSCAGNTQEWTQRLGGALLAHGTIRRRDGMAAALDGYDEGGWWIQDAAAALPALILRGGTTGLNGKTIIDLCAAPGGKTAQLVAMGGDVTAIDNAPERLKTLEENMKRLRMSPAIVKADGTAWAPEEEVDVVLLDAPCSATGTLRRRPDILSHDKPPDLETLTTTQKDLLAAAAKWLKPGGVLVYATCSILKAEGENIAASPPEGLRPLEIRPDEIPGVGITVDGHGFARVMPDAVRVEDAEIIPADMDRSANIPQGNDGFFIARFIKS